MTHAFTSYPCPCYLNAAAVAYFSLEAYLLEFTAVTFPVLGRSEDFFAEKTVFFGLLGTVSDGLGLGHLAVRPFSYLIGRSKTDFN